MAVRSVSVLRPVVKWAGGKTRLLHELLACAPAGPVGTYAEPFCGGAALFFALASEAPPRFARAVLADRNPELVALYRVLRDDVDALVAALAQYRNERELYYEVRDVDPTSLSDVERGARLLFLNKTCFNGLWRVNAKGRFNVPFGRYASPRILDEPRLRAAARALVGADIHLGDFSEVTGRLAAGDFVYFDPPYVPLSKTAAFTAYASGGFSQGDQTRLRDELRALRERGVRAALSNADTPETRALYKEFFVRRVSMPRAINSNPDKRGEIGELLVTTFRPARRRAAAMRARP